MSRVFLRIVSKKPFSFLILSFFTALPSVWRNKHVFRGQNKEKEKGLRSVKRPLWMRCKNGCLLGLIGGGAYLLIELLWRGHTHWSMFFVGGTCFLLIGKIHAKAQKWGRGLCCVVSSAAITAVEFVSGCVVNRWLNWNVWDYSFLPLNLLGQVCLLYSVLWGGLSLLAAPLYRGLEQLLSHLDARFFLRKTPDSAHVLEGQIPDSGQASQ